MTTRSIPIDSVPIDKGDRLHDDHCRLKAQLQWLHEQLTAASLTPAESDRELLKLEAELEQHFTREEQGGLFEQIVETMPELSECVRVILVQHQEFRGTFRALRRTCRWACAESGTRDGWLAEFAEFHRRFDAHECVEHELLHEALNRDVGAGD
jgi:hypothetical protein